MVGKHQIERGRTGLRRLRERLDRELDRHTEVGEERTPGSKGLARSGDRARVVVDANDRCRDPITQKPPAEHPLDHRPDCRAHLHHPPGRPSAESPTHPTCDPAIDGTVVELDFRSKIGVVVYRCVILRRLMMSAMTNNTSMILSM